MVCFRRAGLVKKPVMTGSRKFLLVLAALAVPAYFLPLTRDELSWWWTQSHNHSDNYLHYLSDWPDGRHVVKAKELYERRLWTETTKAEISIASLANSESDAAYRRDQKMRRDNFFWKQASHADTIASYRDYLGQYPQGGHADEARQKIQALGQPANQTNATAQ
jgi:hypothetical protein